MGYGSQIRRKLAALFRRDSLDRDLEEEMQSHLEMQAEEHQQDGMAPAEAHYVAMRQFGNVTLLQEESRRAWGWRWLESLAQDIRFALRMIRRAPLFATVVVVTLGLGIGGNTLVFSLIEAVALRPLPYADPGRLFLLHTVEAESQRSMNSSYPDFRDWQTQSRTFESMAAFNQCDFNLTGPPQPEHVDALCGTAGLLALLGVRAVVGRVPLQGEDAQTAVLSHGLWMRRFGGDQTVVGRAIQLDGRSYTVLGVLPPGFHFPPSRYEGDPEVFVPLVPQLDRFAWYLRVIGRLRHGATEQQARAEMTVIGAGLAKTYPVEQARQGITLDPVVVFDARETALMLLGSVGFVLLIACANVANLMLSQGAARRREFAIRISIGASRGRVIRQLLTESLLLAAFGAVVGIVLARLGLPVLVALAPERTVFFTRVHDAGVQLNQTVLLFTAAVSMVAGVLAGMLPAFRNTAPARGLTRTTGPGRLRGSLIALEIALSFVLLAGAGLMVNSMWRLLRVNLGFRTEHLLTMVLSLPEAKYPAPSRGTTFFGQALRRLEAIPGVASVGGIDDLPLTREWSVNSFKTEGSSTPQGRALFHRISPDYFRTMGIPLLQGRELRETDSEQSAAAVVNRTMASKYWPNDTPIGKGIVISRGYRVSAKEGYEKRFAEQRLEIVGVVGDVRQISRDEEPQPELFMTYRQWPTSGMFIALRTEGDPAALIPAVRREIWRVDPDQPIGQIKTMQALVGKDMAERRFVLTLIGAFASAAVLLAALGIFGVVSYSVRQRTQEIGIRMALGARQYDVVSLVLRQSATWLLLGIAAGAVGAVALTRLLAAQLFGVKPGDPATFVLVGLMLASIALASHMGPARRAAKTDPSEALRHE